MLLIIIYAVQKEMVLFRAVRFLPHGDDAGDADGGCVLPVTSSVTG